MCTCKLKDLIRRPVSIVALGGRRTRSKVGALPSMFERGVVICGNELMRPQKMAVATYDEGSIPYFGAHGLLRQLQFAR
jgi:hypothetical protein